MSEQKVSLPRINSSQSAQRMRPYAEIRRELSSGNLEENLNPTQAANIPLAHPNVRSRKYVQPFSEQKNINIAVEHNQQSPFRRMQSREAKHGVAGRPRSNISNRSNEAIINIDPQTQFNSGTRQDKSALNHIRRIRRHLASQQSDVRIIKDSVEKKYV